ncbi:MAG: enoyl-CoA hydratase-related protein [Bacilli bacterium]
MPDVIQVDKSNGIAVVTITNPPMNVLNRSVVESLSETFARLERDDDVVVIVACGAGERAFMAGADIKEFPDALGQPGQAKQLALRLHEVMNLIDHCPKPTIAALHGFVLGGGLELALAFDMRICDATTQLGLPEIKLGIFPGAGGTQRLPRLIGEAKAKELMFTGESVSAESALAMGLVNRVVAKGEALGEARLLAGLIAKRSLPALRRLKTAIDQGLDGTLAEGVLVEAGLFDEVFQTDDSREGVSAFLEKREPVFKNR